MELEKAISEAFKSMAPTLAVVMRSPCAYVEYAGKLARFVRWGFPSCGTFMMHGLAKRITRHAKDVVLPEPEVTKYSLTYRNGSEEFIVYDLQLRQYYKNKKKSR